MRERKGAEEGRWCSVWIFVVGETWPNAFPVLQLEDAGVIGRI